jgi:hypothetical protein
MSKTYKFFSHFNRVNMIQGKKEVWSVHFRNSCIQGTGITYEVATSTTFKSNGRQPRAKIIGFAAAVHKQPNGWIIIT